MNILFILGNGFDINLGLHTGYQDFYEYYLKQPAKDPVIARLKKYLEKERYTTWADLEIGLGSYTLEVENIDQMRAVYYDLGDELREFLKKEEKSFSATEKVLNAITKGLVEPHSFLPLGMKDSISAYKNSRQPFQIDIISFNYTDTLEKIFQLLPKTNSSIQLNNQTFLRTIRHVHMRLDDDDIIMGVNDESQILNKDLLNDELRGLIVKPYINKELQNLIDIECIRLIRNADLICLFGVSLGKTDLLWWQTIGDRFQKASIRILLFAYDKGAITRNSERIFKYAECKSLLLDRMGIAKPTDEQRDCIYVGYKTSIFKAKQ